MEPTGSRKEACRRLADGEREGSDVVQLGQGGDRFDVDVDGALAGCARTIGNRDITQVHTADQFWALQAVELGLFLTLAAFTVAACFWRLDLRSTEPSSVATPPSATRVTSA